MKLLRHIVFCVLFAACGCTHVTTLEDFVQTISQHNGETINNVWYMGSKEKNDFFRHNTALSSRVYKIYNAMANESDRISLTNDSKRWVLIKDNGSIALKHINSIQCTITNAVIIYKCANQYDNGLPSNLDVAVSFDMPSEVRDSSLALKEGAGNAAPGLHAGVSDDGLMLPIGKDSNYTNAEVIVYMVNVENDASAPREKFAYPFQKEFLNDYVQNYYKLRTDYILVVENHSPYPYAFSPQYAASGYDCLELDFLTSDKRILTASKRMPHLLSDRREENLLKPNWQWKYLISLDIRLWKKPDGFSVDLITHFRPRFAYGAFSVDGKYYRTSAELEAHKRKDRPFKSREGELVGNWIRFQPQQRCWQSWK